MKRRKRLRRPKTKQTAQPRRQSFKLFEHPLNHVDKDVVKAALVAAARDSTVKFPDLLKSLIDHFRNHYPPQIVVTIATYGLQTTVTDEGVSSRSPTAKIQQHHVELLQALALTLPHEEWGREPATPDIIQAVMDCAIEVADAFFHRRLIAMEQERNDQERTVLGLQERLRGHTQMVRNWGYFSAVIQISTELYGALDEDLRAYYGFSATDLIKVASALVATIERRGNERWNVLRRVFRAQKTPQLVRQFFAKFPGVEGDPEEFLKSIPREITYEMVKNGLLAHADIALIQTAVADLDELAQITGRSTEVVTLILERLSFRPGELDANEVEKFFLSNPVWTAPGMNVGGEFFFPIPQVVFSHIHALMRLLVDAAGLQAKLEKQRARYLEAKIKETIERVLPNASLSVNAKWKLDGEMFETDLIGRIDHVILVVEAKSAALTPQGLRGASDRVKRHIRDLVVAPAEQSARLEQIIWKAKAGDATARAVVASVGINPDKVDTVVRISVTLDDFSAISSAEPDLKEAGWVPADLRLAPTLNIADLQCVAEILSEPAYFLHYFAERERIQKTTELMGDELDYLGFYLETGFNAAGFENARIRLIISGMSQAIDHYYDSRDAGVILPKPKPNIHPHLQSIILEVQSINIDNWTTIALDLLRMGSVGEQQRVYRELEKLKKQVAKSYRDPKHLCSILVSPPAHRDACVIFYVYPQARSDQRHDTVDQLVANAFGQDTRRRCIFVGRKIEAWQRPYQFIGVATPGADDP